MSVLTPPSQPTRAAVSRLIRCVAEQGAGAGAQKPRPGSRALRDRLLVPRQGVRAKRTIPGARLIRLPGCGHAPMNDDPALVARVLLDGSR
ncbi:hypothetical protein GCM10027162_54840 [Streptomyces incanus]